MQSSRRNRLKVIYIFKRKKQDYFKLFYKIMKTAWNKEDRPKKKVEKFSNRRYDKNCLIIAKQIVHIRDKETCQRCCKKENLHCSHILNDGKDTRMSVEPDNMKLLCIACHLYRRHKEPTETKDRMEVWRPWLLQSLRDQKNSNPKGSISITRRENKYEELKEKLKKYKELDSL